LSKDAQNFAQIHFIKTRCTSKCSIHNTLWLESWDIQISLQTMLSKAHMFLFKLRTQAGVCNIFFICQHITVIWFNNSDSTVKLHVSMQCIKCDHIIWHYLMTLHIICVILIKI
jgi:hypothetical protein